MSSSSQEKSVLDDCNFWCQTDGVNIERGVGTHQTKFVWQLKNYSGRPEQRGDYIFSDSFTVISPEDVVTKWKLQLYPYGDKSAKDGYLSFYLQAEDQETKSRASYKIYIADNNGKQIYTIMSPAVNEFEPSTGWGWGRRSALLIEELMEKWLIDDVLTLVCEISVLGTNYEVKQNHRSQMMEDLGKAYIDKKSLDVTVNCGDASFKCSKFMLTARSPVFEAMFQHDTEENQKNLVEVKDFQPKVLEEMLKYIHTGSAPNINDLSKELLVAADFYQLDQLKISCQELLSEALDAQNSIEILILSDVYVAPKLKEEALKFVSENMESVSSSCDWKKELAGHPALQSEIIESLMSIISTIDPQRVDVKRASS